MADQAADPILLDSGNVRVPHIAQSGHVFLHVPPQPPGEREPCAGGEHHRYPPWHARAEEQGSHSPEQGCCNDAARQVRPAAGVHGQLCLAVLEPAQGAIRRQGQGGHIQIAIDNKAIPVGAARYAGALPEAG